MLVLMSFITLDRPLLIFLCINIQHIYHSEKENSSYHIYWSAMT